MPCGGPRPGGIPIGPGGAPNGGPGKGSTPGCMFCVGRQTLGRSAVVRHASQNPKLSYLELRIRYPSVYISGTESTYVQWTAYPGDPKHLLNAPLDTRCEVLNDLKTP